MDGINGKSTIDFRNLGDLVAIEVGSSPGALVAQHLIESCRDERNFSEVERTALEEQLAHTEQAQLDSMHDEADAIRSAGLIRGLSQIGAGVAGIASAGAQYRASTSSGSEAAGFQRDSGRYQAGATLLGAAGSAVGAMFDASAKDAAADAASHGHAAQYLERRLKDVGERSDEARVQQQKALDSAAEFVDLEARSAQAALFLRG